MVTVDGWTYGWFLFVKGAADEQRIQIVWTMVGVDFFNLCIMFGFFLSFFLDCSIFIYYYGISPYTMYIETKQQLKYESHSMTYPSCRSYYDGLLSMKRNVNDPWAQSSLAMKCTQIKWMNGTSFLSPFLFCSASFFSIIFICAHIYVSIDMDGMEWIWVCYAILYLQEAH